MQQRGFTLVEIMVTVAIIALLAGMAVPAMLSYRANNRLQGAAESLASFIQSAKQDVDRIDEDLLVQFDANAWCAGMDYEDGTSGCDCTLADPTATDACTLPAEDRVHRIRGQDFPEVAMSKIGSYTTIKHIRGTATAGSVELQLGGGERVLRLVVSNVGRVRICVPAGEEGVGMYPGC